MKIEGKEERVTTDVQSLFCCAFFLLLEELTRPIEQRTPPEAVLQWVDLVIDER